MSLVCLPQYSQCGAQCLSHRRTLINVCWPKLNMFLLNDRVTSHELPFFFSPGHIFISFFPCPNPKACFIVLYNLSVRFLTHKTHVVIPLWGLALSFSRVFQFIRPCTGKPGRQGLRRASQRGEITPGHQDNSKLQWEPQLFCSCRLYSFIFPCVCGQALTWSKQSAVHLLLYVA